MMTLTTAYGNSPLRTVSGDGASVCKEGCLNVVDYLLRLAASVPDQRAVTAVRAARGGGDHASITFAELERLSSRYGNGLASAGISRGMRVMLMVRPGVDFVALVFAMFKLGAVPVMIDPGMGVGRMLECIRQVDLQAFVGIPLAQVMRVLRPAAFRGVQHVVTVGRRWAWGGSSLERLCAGAADELKPAKTRPDEVAAILFTSGSTGPAKGVVYEHGMFDAQIRMIQSLYGIEAGEVDLAAFPLFALFSVAMGMTAVIPAMDPSHPRRVDPQNIVRPILEHGATSAFGSPAVWRKVAPYCIEHGIRLPTLRRVLIAGAPVPWPVIEQLHQAIADDGDVHTPYGATESLPVASISGRELRAVRAPSASDGPAPEIRAPSASDGPPLSASRHADTTSRGLQPARMLGVDRLSRSVVPGARASGTCVGTAVPGIDLRLICITDDPIERWSADLVVPDGAFGEIVVAGPVVTKEYYALPDATRLAKIRDGDRIWHRIGDIGYRDADGRIWFCGRKAHRVVTEHGTMFTECCEPIFNEHPAVERSALVGVGPKGRQRPVLVVELKPLQPVGRARRTVIRDELLALARRHDATRAIQHVLFHPRLPVDVRHNAKINREQLATWAERRCKE